MSHWKVHEREGGVARPLLDRDAELEALGRAIEGAAAGAGSLVVVEGPAGIGKTRLLAAAAETAAGRGLRVRVARGAELEAGMPFGVARQLLEPLIARASDRERRRLLAGSAELALIALGAGRSEQTRAGGDPFSAVHGLYWLTANLAETRPLLLTIDDAHWADAQSLRWLDYLSRRLEDLPVAVVVAARPGEPDAPALLTALRDSGELVSPRPLTAESARALIAVRLAREAAPDLCEACVRATGGNPFLLGELVRALPEPGPDASGPAPAAVAEIGPSTVARSVLARLARFGADAVSLARAIAVLGRSPQLRHAARVAGIKDARAAELCDRLRDADILAPGRPIEFVHPLVGAAIYRDIAEEERSRTHRRAAEVLSATGGGPRELAPHLLACAPNGDEWVVSQLRAAAAEAAAAGAHDVAASYLERALAEPPQDELPVRFELGRALFEADPARSPAMLAEVASRTEDATLRVPALRLVALGHFRTLDVGGAARALSEALDALPADHRDARLLLESERYCVESMIGRGQAASHALEAAAETATGDGEGARLVRQALSIARFHACAPVDEVIALASTPSPPRWEVDGVRVLAPSIACKMLACSGQWERARGEAKSFADAAEKAGMLVGVSSGHGFVAEAERLAGRLPEAEIEARTAWEIAREFAPLSPFGWMGLMNLLATLIDRGDVGAAGELAERLPLSLGPREIPPNPWPIELRGYLRLAKGDLAGAAEDLLALGEAAESFGYLNPALSPWRQEVAPALALLGRADEAGEIVATAEARARAFRAPHLLGMVLRARGLVEPRRRGVDTLRQSVALLERAGPPHELARSQLELGAALRRLGERSAAREPLRRALELAHRTGAGGVETRARDELAAIGSRPRTPFRSGVAALTASELRAARLAAQGLGNREIAERLFVTRRTVEAHLTSVYAKLGISGRDQLADALAFDDAPA